jgi:hypothetical protein
MTTVQVHMVHLGTNRSESTCQLKKVIEVTSTEDNYDELTDTIQEQVELNYGDYSKMNVMLVGQTNPTQVERLMGSLYPKLNSYLPYFITVGDNEPILMEGNDVRF